MIQKAAALVVHLIVLTSSIQQAGAQLTRHMEFQPSSGETLREIFVHSGSIGKVIPDLDDLVGKVTRFAISDYRAAQPPAAGSRDVAPVADSMQAVLQRLDALETGLAELQDRSGE